MKTRIFEAAKVVSPKYGEGVISRIITKSTGYVEVKYSNGSIRKEMAFNLTDENGEALKSKPQSETSGMSRSEKRHLRDKRELAAFNALSNQKKIESHIKWMNGTVYGNESSLGVQIVQKLLYTIQDIAKEKGNGFISNVIDSVIRYYMASDKQAYVIAKYADENGMKYDTIA
jgi:KaiC/GvpD/RAD55 family RecA-like ATPase